MCPLQLSVSKTRDALNERIPDTPSLFVTIPAQLQSQRCRAAHRQATDEMRSELRTRLQLPNPEGELPRREIGQATCQLHQLEAVPCRSQQPDFDVFLTYPLAGHARHSEHVSKPCLEALVKLLDDLSHRCVVQSYVVLEILDVLDQALASAIPVLHGLRVGPTNDLDGRDALADGGLLSAHEGVHLRQLGLQRLAEDGDYLRLLKLEDLLHHLVVHILISPLLAKLLLKLLRKLHGGREDQPPARVLGGRLWKGKGP
mmetsp:Transcript_52611/g.122476  ORF Transcript_52611/g.122476 Transcript_52611/m.122476 type:complete len:258 (+) Transcript_52611:858-1631(+)